MVACLSFFGEICVFSSGCSVISLEREIYLGRDETQVSSRWNMGFIARRPGFAYESGI
jgi:hypothetical protein